MFKSLMHGSVNHHKENLPTWPGSDQGVEHQHLEAPPARPKHLAPPLPAVLTLTPRFSAASL